MISEKNITRRTFLHQDACIHQKSQRSIQKICSALTLTLCGLVIFTGMSTSTKIGRSFKAFLKENYTIALDSCHLFTKKC